MLNFELLLASLIFLALMALLLILILLLKNQMNQKDLIIQNLLNRLMSQDVQTFQRLESSSQNLTSTISNPNSNLVSMSDSAEARRFSQTHGLGDEIYTEDPVSQMELQDMFSDLGLDSGVKE